MSKSPLIMNPEVPSVEKVVEKATEVIPVSYLPISLQSEGVLSMPPVFHMRDYTMEDIIQLNIMEEENSLPNIIGIFNKMIWEKGVDCSDMHSNEFIETMYTLYGNFISPTLEKEYYIDEDLPEGTNEGEKDHVSNIAVQDIPISNFMLQSINEDEEGNDLKVKFKEPFTITDTKTQNKIKFRLSRIKDIIFAQQQIMKKNEKEFRKYATLRRRLNNIRTLAFAKREEAFEKLLQEDEELFENYRKFSNKFDAEVLALTQALTIVSIDGQELTTVDEKLDAFANKISTAVWAKYNEVTDMFPFGIKEEVTFKSQAHGGKEITRRFQFQFTDFLPNTTEQDSGRATVSFD